MKAEEIDDFDQLLEDAVENAIEEWDMDFIADIQSRYDEYEDNCFISEKQLDIIRRIAGEL